MAAFLLFQPYLKLTLYKSYSLVVSVLLGYSTNQLTMKTFSWIWCYTGRFFNGTLLQAKKSIRVLSNIVHVFQVCSTMLVTRKRLRNKLDCRCLSLSMNDQYLEQVLLFQLLGITLDDKLSFDDYVNMLWKKLSQRICVLQKIRRFLPHK